MSEKDSILNKKLVIENNKLIQFFKKANVKGITLISLVITIIILIILAGVAINISLGNSGIFR